MLTPQTINKLAIIAAYGLLGAMAASMLILGLLAVIRDGQAEAQVISIAGDMMKIFGSFLGAMGIVNAAGTFFGRTESPAGQAMASPAAPPASATAVAVENGPSNG